MRIDTYDSFAPRPASDRQLRFLAALLDEREIPATAEATAEERRAKGKALVASGRMTSAQASKSIEFLLGQPKLPEQGIADVPAGRYALVEEDGVTRFYKVDRPTEGRWEGMTFLSIFASSETHPIKDRRRKARVLAEIAADVEGSLRRYGHELGHCGVCGRELTDETSRERGIGPVCYEKGGYEF